MQIGWGEARGSEERRKEEKREVEELGGLRCEGGGGSAGFTAQSKSGHALSRGGLGMDG